MANTYYTRGFGHVGRGDITLNDAGTAQLRAALLDLTAYTPDFVADEVLADIPGAAVISDVAVTGQAFGLDGALTVDAFTFPTVWGVPSCAAMVFYAVTGGGSYLLLYFDTATGLPVTPTGGDVVVTPAANIFAFGGA